MENLANPDVLDAILQSSQALLIYFSHPGCQVCQSLKPRVEAMVREFFPALSMVYVNVREMPELAARYTVFLSPTLLVFFNGSEIIRKSRIFGVEDLKDALERPYSLFFS